MMATRREQRIRFRACPRCGGDAYLDVLDGPEWRCLQCARLLPAEAAESPGGGRQHLGLRRTLVRGGAALS